MNLANAWTRLDWAALADEIDAYGCAQTAQLLDTERVPGRSRRMYDEVERFRSTVDMARHRFGAGQYRYFDHPLPESVAELRAAFYPHLLPIARDWADRLGRPAPWPDTLDEWLDMCHDAGQTSRRPSCCATARATGTPCTATSTATWCSRCRS